MRASLVVALLVVSAGPAWAQLNTLKPAARAKLDKGLKLASEKKFDEAIKELRAGYAIQDAREFLYALGQAERLRGDCKRALVHYQAFLDTTPPAGEGAAAKLQIDRCDAELAAAAPKPEPAPAPVVAQAPPPPAPAADAPVVQPKEEKPLLVAPPKEEKPVAVVTQAPRKAWYTDPLGDVLLVSGAVVAGGGVAAFVAGNVAAQNSRASLDNYAAAKQLSWAQPVGIVGMAAGGALMVGAIIRFATLNPIAPAVSVAPTGDGAALVVSGGF